MAAAVNEEMSWEKMQPLMRQLYKETFTQSEVDGMTAFYKSPAGIALVEKMPIIFQKSQEMMKPYIPRIAARGEAIMQEMIEELKATADANTFNN
jgi:hypothetical protein